MNSSTERQARDRKLDLAERQRQRAIDTARHALLWLELDKGPRAPKVPGDVAWSYDLNEALVLLRDSVNAVERALRNT